MEGLTFEPSWSSRGSYSTALTAAIACGRAKLTFDGRHLRQYRLNSADLIADPCAPRAAWFHALLASPWRLPETAIAERIAAAYRRWRPGMRVSLAVAARSIAQLSYMQPVALRSAEEIMSVVTRGLGPVVLGLPWTEDMELPDLGGVIHTSGPAVGGHAVTVTGGDLHRASFRLTNNRGLSWGQAGRAWLAQHELNAVISKQSFEAFVLLAETAVAKTPTKHGMDDPAE